ncbi:nuclease-related domain-containing protein [Acinetobacter baumannii]
MRKITILSPSGLLPTEAVAINEINNAMPNTWKGYASFFVNDGKKRGMEIDLLLVTGDRLILCELKNWFGSIESDGTNWNQIINGRVVNRHPSPVGTKRTHAERLQQLLGNELQRE